MLCISNTFGEIITQFEYRKLQIKQMNAVENRLEIFFLNNRWILKFQTVDFLAIAVYLITISDKGFASNSHMCQNPMTEITKKILRFHRKLLNVTITSIAR